MSREPQSAWLPENLVRLGAPLFRLGFSHEEVKAKLFAGHRVWTVKRVHFQGLEEFPLFGPGKARQMDPRVG